MVDDYSTDDSVYQIQQTLKGSDSTSRRYYQVLVNSKNLGQNASIDAAIANSSGDYICFLDSDDSFRKDFTETMTKLMTENIYIQFTY